MNRERNLRPRLAPGFRFEIGRLGALLDRWLTSELNRIFDLSIGAARRRVLQTTAFLLILGAAAVGAHVWLAQFHPFLSSDGNGALPLASQVPLYALRVVLILGIASSIALRASGRFVADIFACRRGWFHTIFG